MWSQRVRSDVELSVKDSETLLVSADLCGGWDNSTTTYALAMWSYTTCIHGCIHLPSLHSPSLPSPSPFPPSSPPSLPPLPLPSLLSPFPPSSPPRATTRNAQISRTKVQEGEEASSQLALANVAFTKAALVYSMQINDVQLKKGHEIQDKVREGRGGEEREEGGEERGEERRGEGRRGEGRRGEGRRGEGRRGEGRRGEGRRGEGRRGEGRRGEGRRGEGRRGEGGGEGGGEERMKGTKGR